MSCVSRLRATDCIQRPWDGVPRRSFAVAVLAIGFSRRVGPWASSPCSRLDFPDVLALGPVCFYKLVVSRRAPCDAVRVRVAGSLGLCRDPGGAERRADRSPGDLDAKYCSTPLRVLSCSVLFLYSRSVGPRCERVRRIQRQNFAKTHEAEPCSRGDKICHSCKQEAFFISENRVSEI